MTEKVYAPLKTYTCAGFIPVKAYTRSEARAKFKAQMSAWERLKFVPGKVTRLPAGVNVEEVRS